MFSFVFFGLIGSHVTHSQIGQFGTTHNCTDHHEQSLKLPLLLLITSLLFQEPPPRPRSKVLNDNWNLSIGHRHQNRRFSPICGHFWLFHLGGVGVEAALDQDLSAYCVSRANKLLLPSLNFKHISCSMAASSLDAKYTFGTRHTLQYLHLAPAPKNTTSWPYMGNEGMNCTRVHILHH